MKITVLSPHCDDAAFSVGLAIDTWIATGHTVEVLNCFTRSRYSPYGDLDFVHPNDLLSYVTALRHREDLRWSRKYGRPVTLVDLNLRDAPQRLQCGIEDVCSIAQKQDDSSVARIRGALKKANMNALVLPLALGKHVDHRTARQAAQEGWPDTLPIAFYEDLPYAARPSVADQVQECVDSIGQQLQPGFVNEAGDVAVAAERKRQLALCYDSQVDSETIEQITTFCERYGGRERLWMNRAWRESLLAVSQ